MFLYPENWLEPELRDGKSPFFRDLESELLKGDVTQELAELAYLHYLRKLDDVAHLEIAGAFLEEKT
ncbi:neuraminidase-like domain-containing protein, partial [Escherichia coli]|uniref:neuraminidase-like domain-containing protein n=1 Tax=Escherichia coli TaxID=562 RepID=UPI00196373BE